MSVSEAAWPLNGPDRCASAIGRTLSRAGHGPHRASKVHLFTVERLVLDGVAYSRTFAVRCQRVWWVCGACVADKTILIVDYDSVFRSSLVDILNEAGYKAYGASDGSHAISVATSLGTNDVDLLVLEMAQPDMTGVELIHILASEQKTTIKVIASSSLFSQADVNSQTAFRSNAGVRKEATATPAVAAKWLLTIGSLLGELAAAAPTPSRVVILLADDDPDVRHFVKIILNREGYQVLEAADGESALALARKMAGAVDLLVTDVQMPGMGGRALAEAIRQEDAHIPVIYISGYVEEPDSDVKEPEKGFAFIAKPFRPKDLLNAVSLMLKQVKRAE
jgi:CheY-like chemotaxis protein